MLVPYLCFLTLMSFNLNYGVPIAVQRLFPPGGLAEATAAGGLAQGVGAQLLRRQGMLAEYRLFRQLGQFLRDADPGQAGEQLYFLCAGGGPLVVIAPSLMAAAQFNAHQPLALRGQPGQSQGSQRQRHPQRERPVCLFRLLLPLSGCGLRCGGRSGGSGFRCGGLGLLVWDRGRLDSLLRLLHDRGRLQNVPAPGAVIIVFHPGVGIVGGHPHRLPGLGLHPVAGDVARRDPGATQQHCRRRGKVDAVAPLRLPQKPEGKVRFPLAHGSPSPVIRGAAADILRHRLHRLLHALGADTGGLKQLPGPQGGLLWQGKPLISGVGGQGEFPQQEGPAPLVPLRRAVGEEHLPVGEGGDQLGALAAEHIQLHRAKLLSAARQGILPGGGGFPGHAGVYIVILHPQVNAACPLRRDLRHGDPQQQLGGQAGKLHLLPGPQAGEQADALTLHHLGQVRQGGEQVFPQGLSIVHITVLGEAIKQRRQRQSNGRRRDGGQAACLGAALPADAVRQQQQAHRRQQAEQIPGGGHGVRHHQAEGQAQQKQQHGQHIAPAAAYRAAHRQDRRHAQHRQRQILGRLRHLQGLRDAKAIAAVVSLCQGAQQADRLGAEDAAVPQPGRAHGRQGQQQRAAPAAKQHRTAQYRPQQPHQQHRLPGRHGQLERRTQAAHSAPGGKQRKRHGFQKYRELTFHRRHLRCDTASWRPSRHPRHPSGRPRGCTAGGRLPSSARFWNPHGRPAPPRR